MTVPIIKLGPSLIATAQSSVTDSEWRDLESELLKQSARFRSTGVILDVTLLDVLDSYATRTLRNIALTTWLKGAHTVLVGIQPGVAIAMVSLGLATRLERIDTALDMEAGLRLLDRRL